MSTWDLSSTMTLGEIAKRHDAGGDPMPPVEVLAKSTPELQDIPFLEANEKTRHRVSQRNSLPAGQSRTYNMGVTPSASSTEVNVEVIEMLEDYSRIDEHLAAHTGNPAYVRSTEDNAFLMGMGHTLGSRIFYGNHSTEPLQMTGLAPRLAATNSATIVSNGGSGSDVTSIYLVQWGPDTVHGIYPTGTRAGVVMNDKGLQEVVDSNGKIMYMWTTQFTLQFGLVVKDPQAIARVANIEVSGSDNLFDWEAVIDVQSEMLANIPIVGYCSRKVYAQILKAAINKPNNLLNMQNVFGDGMMPTINGIPMRMSESIVNTETAIS